MKDTLGKYIHNEFVIGSIDGDSIRQMFVASYVLTWLSLTILNSLLSPLYILYHCFKLTLSNDEAIKKQLWLKYVKKIPGKTNVDNTIPDGKSPKETEKLFKGVIY